MLNGFPLKIELEGVLKSDYYKSPLGYNNVDWFVNEVVKIEKKMAFYFKNTKKDIIMTKEDEEDFKNNNVCGICVKSIDSDKIRDHCHLTSKYRGPALSKCIFKVIRDKNVLHHLYFTTLVNMIVKCFFKKVVDKMKDK